MPTGVDRKVAAAALSDLARALASDGYTLSIDMAADDLIVCVGAGEGACAGCLVPKSILREAIMESLRIHGLDITAKHLEIRMPHA